VQQGYQAQRIARELNLETCTVNNHIANIRKKLGLKNKKVNLRCFLRDAKFS
jgi:DNA-binding NarL/FixJ family response regulator